MVRIRRALISVSDKRGVEELARGLARHGVAILSTGGTARALRQAGIAVTEVAEYTGAPEILDGRVKTLHPRIHAGLLARPTAEHDRQLAEQHIERIDLVAVNLYPFRETVTKPGVTFADAIEHIDIGGPSMLRSAAKNHERVTVLVDPDDYATVLGELDAHDGQVAPATRWRLAVKAFQHTAGYDAGIANFLGALPDEPLAAAAHAEPTRFPPVVTLQWDHGQSLRYGENPHQAAAFYRDSAPPDRPSVAWSDVLQGKELSYNNLLDLDSALGLVLELAEPGAAIVKHNNPCGAATAASLAEAYLAARECDPVSAFGGVVALNRTVDRALAEKLVETFLECVIAPGFDEAARQVLAAKKNVRLLAWRTPPSSTTPPRPMARAIAGGLLVQGADRETLPAAQAKVATRRAPSAAERAALDFAWRVCKHVKSNAIVLARPGVTVGIGAGQMSRVDSVRIAVEKAKSGAQGTVMASDAFFPFRDGIDEAAKAGVSAVISPGGSVRDAEVIAACEEHGMAMLFTGMRHFRH